MTIKAIETRYAGHRFRSRLEARWAVFFDHLGLAWEYEPQGYVLDGEPYLPDFKLLPPGGNISFAEVKNAEVDQFEGDHIRKCHALARAIHCPVILLSGLPAFRMYNQFAPGALNGSLQAAFFVGYGQLIETADQYWFQSVEMDEQTGALNFLHDDRGRIKSFGEKAVAAVAAARSARFEHGEAS